MKSYTFKVALEKDNKQAIWRAYIPALEHKGATTWAYTQEAALQHIRVLLHMVLQEMVQQGEPIPAAALVNESEEPLVTVTLT